MSDLKDIIGTTINMRSAQFAKNLEAHNQLMRIFDNLPKPPPPTRLQKAQAKVEELQQRIRDAIKVLRGKAEICDPYDD